MNDIEFEESVAEINSYKDGGSQLSKFEQLSFNSRKVLMATFILAKGKSEFGVPNEDIFSLVQSMSHDELVRNCRKIMMDEKALEEMEAKK